MGHVRDAGHLDLDGRGDLLLDLFGGAAGPLGDDLNVVVGDVGVGLDGKVMEGDDAPAEEHDGSPEDEPPIVQCKIDECRESLLIRRILQRERVRDDLLADVNAGDDLLHVARQA